MKSSASQPTLILGFGAIICLMIIVGIVGVTMTTSSLTEIDELAQQVTHKEELILEMRRVSRERTVSLQKMVILSDPFARDEEAQIFRELGGAFITARDQLAPLLSDRDQKALFDKTMELVQQNAPRQIALADKILDGETHNARNALEHDIIPRQVAIYNTLTELLDLVERQGLESASRAREAYQNALSAIVVLDVLALIISSFIAAYVIKRIKHTEHRLARERERAEVTLHSIGDAVLTISKQGVIEQMNDVAERLTGYSRDEARTLPYKQVLPIIDEITHSPVSDPLGQALNGIGVITSDGNAILIDSHEQEYAIEYTAAPIMNEDRVISGAILVFRDVTDMRQLSHELTYQARHDAQIGRAHV